MRRRAARRAGSWLPVVPAIVVLSVSSVSRAAQEAPQEPPVFGVQATAILVDVVVRDKKGRLVRDLAPADFELFEDGARQTLASFRVVDNAPPPEESDADSGVPPVPTPPPSADGGVPPASTPASLREGGPCVIALVFDRLSPGARQVAHQAALAYAERGHVSGDLVGVFSVDLALHTHQAFTSDLESVRVALRQAASQAPTAFASDRDEARDRLQAATKAAETLEGMQGQGAGSTAAALIASQQAFDQMQVNMLRTFDAMERDQQGYATTHGLLAVVSGLRPLPGRKTIVFFSEGIAIPANVQAQFRSVIATANRANVSIYAMDAAGLRAESGLREAREELMQASQRRLRQLTSGRDDAPDGAMTRQLERNEDILRLNPESGLAQLAEETGGFLVRDTNDARSGFGRIAEDMRFHYVLSYSPTNERLDGGFRTIAVKLRRPDLKVQSRKGYFAVRPQEDALPVREYEAPALAELDREPRPDAFPIGVAALSFPERARPGLVPVLVSLSPRAVAWSREKASVRADFAVVVRIKDEHGREADRLSQEYRLTAPVDKLETARQGDVLFYREASLAPGPHTVEAVAYDSIARTASVRTTAVVVPSAADDRLRLSSLVLVSRAEPLPAEEQKGANPLRFGEAMLYPNLGAPFRKSSAPALGFYFSLYGKTAAGVGRATIEVRQGARVLAQTATPLPAPDTSGRIQHAGAVPLQGLAPGAYSLKITVSDGASVDSRSAAFDVVE